MSDTPEPHSPIRSHISDLPEEVLDIILDWARRVDRHKRTLRACRNVSRAWSHITLKHYFHSLSLIFRLKGESSIITCFIQDFVHDEVLDMVKPYVQELTLTSGMKMVGPITPDLLEYVTFFPALRQLNLTGVLSTPIPRDIFSSRGYTPSITSLTVNQSRNSSRLPQSLGILCDLLRMCEGVRRLRLSGLDCPRHVAFDEWQAVRGVTSLAVRNVGSELLHAFAAQTSLFSNLRRLDLQRNSLEKTQNLDAFFKFVAAQIEHLEYNVTCKQLDAAGNLDYSPVSSLAACQALRSLSMEVEHHGWSGYGDSHNKWRALVHAFASLNRHAKLDFVALRLVCRDIVSFSGANRLDPSRLTEHLHSGLVADVDTALATMVSEGRLRRVYTGLYSCPAEDGPRHLFLRHVPGFLESTFPRLHDLGVLQLLDVYGDASE